MNNSKDLSQRYKASVLIPWFSQQDIEPKVIKDAQGVYFTLMSGQKMLDMKSQAFCANLGHAHAGMRKAMSDAALNAHVLSSEIYCPERLALAEKLIKLAPNTDTHKLKKVFYTLGGAEANENAIKMARLFTKKHKIITRYRSYHGATLATINFSGDYRRIAVDNAMSGIVRFPDPYPRGSRQNIDTVRLLEEIIEIEGAETIAAIMLEGITGANGVFIPPKDYWPKIRKIADDNNILLIADEVFSGFYRTGPCWAVEHFGVCPDILTMSKGLTAGYAPLGATMVNEKIAAFFDRENLACGLTQYGNFISCATANAALRFYEEEAIANNVKSRGAELAQNLAKLRELSPVVAEIRSIGLLAAVDLCPPGQKEKLLVPYRAKGQALEPAKMLQKFLSEEGVSSMVRFSTLLIAPPLNIKANELDEGLFAISKALAKLCVFLDRK